MKPNPFPPAPPPGLSADDVVDLLSQYQAAGWTVFQEGEHGFRLQLADHGCVSMAPEGRAGQWRVTDGFDGRELAKAATNLPELRHLLENVAAHYGFNLRGVPPVARLAKAQPASNLGRLARLIGQQAVDSVFDPYLDNPALLVLADLRSLGVRISSSLRLLTGLKLVKSSRLTQTYVLKFLTEVAPHGEIRCLAESEHRRFVLLSGGSSLLIGCSWNDLAKNEVASLGAGEADRKFFDERWSRAAPPW